MDFVCNFLFYIWRKILNTLNYYDPITNNR